MSTRTLRAAALRELDVLLDGIDASALSLIAALRNLARAHAVAEAAAYASFYAMGIANDLLQACDNARASAYELDVGLAHTGGLARTHAGDLARHLANARDLELAIARDLDCNLHRNLDLNLDRSRDIVESVKLGRRRVHELIAAAMEIGVPLDDLDARVALTGATMRVLNTALRVLPLDGRVRYREELEAELLELARADAPRRTQLMYALRLAGRMWSLRRALRATAPEREQVR